MKKRIYQQEAIREIINLINSKSIMYCSVDFITISGELKIVDVYDHNTKQIKILDFVFWTKGDDSVHIYPQDIKWCDVIPQPWNGVELQLTMKHNKKIRIR